MSATKEEPQPSVLTTQEHRLERFLSLGFDGQESECLSKATMADGFFLYWGDVKKYMDQGATREQIVDWFTYPENSDC